MTKRSVLHMVQEGSLYVLLFLLPCSIAAIEITFGILLLTWMMQRVIPATRGESIWSHPSLRAILLWVGGYVTICALSIAVSRYPEKSFSGLVNKWLEYVLLTVIIAEVAVRPRVAVRGLWVVVGSSMMVLIEAISQELTGAGVFRHRPLVAYGRMTGPYNNPIDLGTYLMVIIPVILAWAMCHRGFVRWALGSLTLVLLGCLVRTEALGAWLGLCAGLVVWFIVDRRMRWLIIAVLALLGFSVVEWLHHIDRMGDAFSLQATGTKDRWFMWQTAIHMIHDRPFLGHGLNTFMANYLDYWVGGERTPRYAHNCYLQVAAETGLAGLMAFLGLLAGLCVHLVSRLRRAAASDRTILAGMLAGLTAFVVQAAVDTNFYSLRQSALFWTLAGLAVGMNERHVAAVPASSRGET